MQSGLDHAVGPTYRTVKDDEPTAHRSPSKETQLGAWGPLGPRSARQPSPRQAAMGDFPLLHRNGSAVNRAFAKWLGLARRFASTAAR